MHHARTALALRLGWSLAEVRGLCNPFGPRPDSDRLPTSPDGLLPLRSERQADAARDACSGAAVRLAGRLGLAEMVPTVTGTSTYEAGVDTAVTMARRSDAEQLSDAEKAEAWAPHRAFFHSWDAQIQNELSARNERHANAYLLGRGLAECYWALEPGADRGVPADLGFLLGTERRKELTRMLGRLPAGQVHSLTPAVVSGSLAAWGQVLDSNSWDVEEPLQTPLYEQVRRWYQLMVLDQDPTTLVLPYSRLGGAHQLGRNLRLVWPQALLAVLGVALVSWFFLGDGETRLDPLLGAGGAWLVVAAGLLGRARNGAQLWATRLRQDAYTDLVAIDCAYVPNPSAVPWWRWWLRRRPRVESAVRRRRLTPPTFVPDLATGTGPGGERRGRAPGRPRRRPRRPAHPTPSGPKSGAPAALG